MAGNPPDDRAFNPDRAYFTTNTIGERIKHPNLPSAMDWAHQHHEANGFKSMISDESGEPIVSGSTLRDDPGLPYQRTKGSR